MPGCVIILPKTAPPKMVSGRLDLSFGIFARRGENTVATLAVGGGELGGVGENGGHGGSFGNGDRKAA